MKDLRRFLASFCFFSVLALTVAFPATSLSQHNKQHESEQPHKNGPDSLGVTGVHEHADGHAAHSCHFHGEIVEDEFDATTTAFHHIADANVYSIGSFNFPFPCILYA